MTTFFSFQPLLFTTSLVIFLAAGSFVPSGTNHMVASGAVVPEGPDQGNPTQSLMSKQENNNDNGSNEDQSLDLITDDDMIKRGWNDLSGVWGKRGWNDLSGVWGKRGWNNLNGMWGKRGWNNLNGMWGKKRGWNDLSGMWGKRSSPNWNNLKGLWGKRPASQQFGGEGPTMAQRQRWPARPVELQEENSFPYARPLESLRQGSSPMNWFQN